MNSLSISARRFGSLLILCAGWLLLIRARPFFIHPSCGSPGAHGLSGCNPLSLLPVDRYALGKDSSFGERLSLATQYISGTLVLFVPLVFHFFREGVTRKAKALRAYFQDLFLISQAILLTGIATELARLLVQRPRPFVYGNPGYYGLDPQNYTSFFSGHTSFAAGSTIALVFVLWRREAPRWCVQLMTITSFVVVLATAWGRVIAGRHFVTDVLAGAVAGALIAFWTTRPVRAAQEAYFTQT